MPFILLRWEKLLSYSSSISLRHRVASFSASNGPRPFALRYFTILIQSLSIFKSDIFFPFEFFVRSVSLKPNPMIPVELVSYTVIVPKFKPLSITLFARITTVTGHSFPRWWGNFFSPNNL